MRILSQKVTPQRVEVEAEAEDRGLVVMAQTFYHCWRAYLDGVPVPILRANFGFQAVEIPAGRHRVQWRYKDNAFLWGAAVSVGSLLGCMGAWFWMQRGLSKRKQNVEG